MKNKGRKIRKNRKNKEKIRRNKKEKEKGG